MKSTRAALLTSLVIITTAAVVSSPTVRAGGNDVACEAAPDQVADLVCGDDTQQSESPSPESPAVSSIQDLACDMASTLTDFITCVRTAAPPADSELYTPPTLLQSQAFAFVVEQMMTDMDDGVLDCDAVVPTGLDEHYRVSPFRSSGRDFCVFFEFLDADVDGTADLGWGTVVYARDAHNELCVQASHPRVDLFTEWEAVELFELAHARTALIAGAHRYANSQPSPCQGHLTGTSGDPYYESDAAHNVDPFYAAGRAIADYYGVEYVDGVADFSGVELDFYALQLHGMGASSCGQDHVFLSNGDRSPVQPGDAAQRLADALQLYNPQWNVAYRGDGESECLLTGSENTLARLFNEVMDIGSDDIDNPICSFAGVEPDFDPYFHPAVSGRFLHVEQKRCIEGTSCGRDDPDSIRNAAFWAAAVAETFDAPTCTNGLHDGDELGIDCGGSCPLPCAASACDDGVQNGDELGIDCGGSCLTPCPTCNDGTHNGDEQGIDCGGSCPMVCADCNDGIHNGDEQGVDCGGSCPTACPTCSDNLQNGDEQGIDCGGTECPTACSVCLAANEGMGCNDTTNCCSGAGNCTHGKPWERVCLPLD